MAGLGLKRISDGAGQGTLITVDGCQVTYLAPTSPTGTVSSFGIQINSATPANSQSNYAGALCRVWSTSNTAPGCTITFYDVNTATAAAGTTAIWTGTLAANNGTQPLQLDIPIMNGLFYALSTSVAANTRVGISWN